MTTMAKRQRVRYELEEKMVSEAVDRAKWRLGNRFASPIDAANRSRREAAHALRELDEATMARLTKDDYERVIQLSEDIEEATLELLCLLSPPEQDESTPKATTAKRSNRL